MCNVPEIGLSPAMLWLHLCVIALSKPFFTTTDQEWRGSQKACRYRGGYQTHLNVDGQSDHLAYDIHLRPVTSTTKRPAITTDLVLHALSITILSEEIETSP